MKLFFLSIWFLDAFMTADVAAFLSSNHAVRSSSSSRSSSSLSLLGGDESINILFSKRRRVLGVGTTKRIPASAAVAVAVGSKTSSSSRSTISSSNSSNSRNPSSSNNTKRKQNKYQKYRPYNFNSIEAVHAYANLGNIEQADNILKEICISHFSINSRRFSSSSTSIRKTKLVPNVSLFNTVLKACARSKVKKAPEKVQSILQFMKEQTTIQPNVITYNTIMDCWAKSKRPNAGEKAEAYLREMIMMSQNSHHDDDDDQQTTTTTIVQPDTISYNTVINAYANLGDANRAQYILNTMLSQNNDDKNNNKSEQPHSMINIFDDDVDVVLPSSSSSSSVQPNVRSFNTVLMAWSKSNEKKAPEMAEAILHSMKKQQIMDTQKSPSLSAATNDHQNEEHLFTIDDQNNIVLHYNVQPDIISYNTVINCWSKSQRADSGTRAEAILREMMSEEGVGVTPDTITYSTVINAYANIGNANRAEQIVNEMYDNYYNITTPSNYNSVAKPTVECFSTVLKAWSKSKENDAPERATALLERMKGTTNMIQPNMVSYTTVMDSWAKSGRPDAGEQAEEILREMEQLSSESPKYAHLQPNIISYNTVINAYANNGNAEKAESILDELCIGALVQNIKKSSYQQQQQGEKAKPNVRTFTTVLKAWAKRAASEDMTTKSEEGRNDAPEKAEILLERMKDLSNNNVLPDLAPNRVSYTAVMDCWAKAKRDNSGKQAEAILREMIRLSSTSPDISPTIRSYNTVINAYANLGDAHNAEIILKELLSHNNNNDDNNNNNNGSVVTPNICSFNTVLKAYSKTRSPKNALQNAERIVNVLKNNNHNNNDNNKEQQNLSLLDIKPDAATNKILKSIRRRNDNNNKRKALR